MEWHIGYQKAIKLREKSVNTHAYYVDYKKLPSLALAFNVCFWCLKISTSLSLFYDPMGFIQCKYFYSPDYRLYYYYDYKNMWWYKTHVHDH